MHYNWNGAFLGIGSPCLVKTSSVKCIIRLEESSQSIIRLEESLQRPPDPQLFFWSLWPRHYQNASDGPVVDMEADSGRERFQFNESFDRNIVSVGTHFGSKQENKLEYINYETCTEL